MSEGADYGACTKFGLMYKLARYKADNRTNPPARQTCTGDILVKEIYEADIPFLIRSAFTSSLITSGTSSRVL